jgi:hypothetical protein
MIKHMLNMVNNDVQLYATELNNNADTEIGCIEHTCCMIRLIPKINVQNRVSVSAIYNLLQ